MRERVWSRSNSHSNHEFTRWPRRYEPESREYWKNCTYGAMPAFFFFNCIGLGLVCALVHTMRSRTIFLTINGRVRTYHFCNRSLYRYGVIGKKSSCRVNSLILTCRGLFGLCIICTRVGVVWRLPVKGRECCQLPTGIFWVYWCIGAFCCLAVSLLPIWVQLLIFYVTAILVLFHHKAVWLLNRRTR